MSIQTRIADLVQAKLSGNKIDVVGFVDELLTIISASGEIRCGLATDHSLRFEAAGGTAFDVDLDASRGKLRMLCARLSVLCSESSGIPVSPYGGDGTIRIAAANGKGPQECSVQFKNTPDAQEFSVSRVQATRSQPVARA